MTNTKTIPNFNSRYTIDEYGNVWSKFSNKFLNAYKQNKGYLSINLSLNGAVSTHLVHRLVAEAYCNKPEGCNVVNHVDNNPLNNHYSNLEWTTTSGNLKHAAKQGRLGHTQRLLTEQDVEEIWSLWLETRESTAKKYNVRIGTIRAIYEGKTWKHLYDKYSNIKNTLEKVKGSRQSGDTNATAKLSTEQVLNIVENYKEVPQTTVGKLFNVSKSTIGLIRTGDTWCTVTYPYITPKKWPRGIPTPEGVDTTGWGFS
jgi:HNH endonuclease